MNRTQTKCFTLSVLAHGMLLVAILCFAAFRPAPRDNNSDEITITMDPSATLTDEATSGGNPAPPAPAPAPPKSEPVKPVVAPEPENKPEPRSAPPIKVKTPEPEPEPDAVKPKQPDPEDFTLTPKPVKPKPEKKYMLKPVSVKDRKPVKDTAAEDAEEAENARKAERDRKAADEKARNDARATREAIDRWSSRTSGGSLTQLRDNLSTSVKIEGPIGVGGGGAANNNWTSLVKKIYEDHFTPPEGGRSLVTVVRVTVQRNGTVLSDPIIKSSGDIEYDRAVNDALRQVRKLPKFPESASDEQRALTIRFIPPSTRNL